MNTPLYTALRAFADGDPLRLHMPGHKGRLGGAFAALSPLDFTELPPVGDLYADAGPVGSAEALFAQAYGAADCLFLAGGATQGIYAMLGGLRGKTLILDRGCHRSVYQAMALLDITPVYLFPGADPDTGLPRPVSPALLEEALAAHPEAAAALVTTPGYYGTLTDLEPLAAVCQRYHVHLLADQAHGAHLPWVGLPSAVQQGAGLAVISAHKTLPALTGAAALLTGPGWDKAELKARTALFGSTSPSWPILASMDYARGLLEARNNYPEAAALVSEYRERINRETPFRALSGPGYDPCRLTVDVSPLDGKAADRLLREQNVYLEMADERYLVAIVTCADTREDLERYLTALKTLPAGEGSCPGPEPPPAPLLRAPLSVLFGAAKTLPLKKAAGRICAQIVAPYPPGLPVLAPGEEITEKHIAYLQKKRYNIREDVRVAPPGP